MKTEKIKITELVPMEGNIRRHSPKQIEEFARSIKMFGQFRPVVIDENNVVLAGNGLVMALNHLGIETAECLRYNDLSEKDKKKLMIADNKIFELGSSNAENLFDALSSIGDYDVPGFDEDVLKGLLGDAEKITQDIGNYGIINTGTKERIERRKEEKDKKIETGELYREAEQVNEEVGDKGEPTLHCPHCGGAIWL